MKLTTDEYTGRRFGKYEVLCRLAVGGMAEIFLGFAAQGPFTGRTVVIKRILSELRADPSAMQMLLDEARLTATLMHPNVAQVLDLEVASGEVLLVIEFIGGANLEEVVESYTSRGEAVPLGFALAVIRETAQALAHAHGHKDAKGAPVPIVHRDVTPRNVMVDFEGHTKVLDFGIARAKGGERRTQAGMVRGTTAYMSPEQAIGKDPDPRSDLFSLGVIFHELLTGKRLFYKGNPAQEMAAVYEAPIPLPSVANKRVPKALDAVVMKALERKIDRRYQSGLELIRDLSLAAGSTAWPMERCAELVRERFAKRREDIGRLVARIPRQAPPPPPPAPPAPKADEVESFEASTVVTTGPAVPAPPVAPAAPVPPPFTSEAAWSELRTQVGVLPSSASPAGARPVEPPPEPVTDPGAPSSARRVDLPFDSPSRSGTSDTFEPNADFDSTRILPGGSKPSLPPVASKPILGGAAAERSPLPPLPASTPAEAPGPSRAAWAAAVVAALLLGVVGGVFIGQGLQEAPAPAPLAWARLTVATDREARVFLGKVELGPTPLAIVVPVGRHALELREANGAAHALSVELPAPGVEAKLDVTLDSLPALP